jgi:hypothetical protein
MCEGEANTWRPQSFIDSGYMHTILLKDLQSFVKKKEKMLKSIKVPAMRKSNENIFCGFAYII